MKKELNRIAVSLLLASMIVVSFLPFTVGESNENDAEVWFHDVYFETIPNDGHDEESNSTIRTINIFFDLETDSNDIENAIVELNVWSEENELVDEIIEDYTVSSDNLHYHEMSWSSSDGDLYCFELWIHDTNEEEWFCDDLHGGEEDSYWYEDKYYETDF